jgi:hypothetical protein
VSKDADAVFELGGGEEDDDDTQDHTQQVRLDSQHKATGT